MIKIAEKFAGFYAHPRDLNIIQKVNYVKGQDKSGFNQWLPNDSEDYHVRTLIDNSKRFTHFKETLPTQNWNEQMRYASSKLVLLPVKSGELMLENTNSDIKDIEFREGRGNTWRINSWLLKLLDGETKDIKPNGPLTDTDLIGAFIDWERKYLNDNGENKVEKHTTIYAWTVYRR